MSLNDIIEIAAVSAGCITTVVIGFGMMKGVYNSLDAKEHYKNMPHELRDAIGKPKISRMYVESILNAPKHICYRLINKKCEDSFSQYIEKTQSKDIMKNEAIREDK